MNQALEIQAFSETTGWLLGKMVSPIHTNPARTTHVTGCFQSVRSNLFPDSQRAQDNNNRANNIGSVGMYHPTDVSPNSLKLMDSGTRANTTPM